MKRSLLFLLLLLFVTGVSAQRNSVLTAEKTPPPLDPMQFQGPPMDIEPPTVVCLNIQQVTLAHPGQISLWASDFLQSVSDNETPAAEIRTGIRKSGTGTGFPVGGNGVPIQQISFDCTELGIQSVELWAMDLAGNATYCTASVEISDLTGYCDPNNYDSIRVCVSSGCNGAPMEGVYCNVFGTVWFQPPFPGFVSDTVTGPDGCAKIYLLSSNNTYTIVPEKKDDPLNGVTTYDLLLISKHILGLEPLDNPYRMIAADANKSGSITTFDLIELRKLIMGIYTELPNNTSWRFVDSDFEFPNPMNPFATSFPEQVSVEDGLFSDTLAFYGVKIGDVDCTATLHGLAPDPDYPDALLAMPDTLLAAGQVYELPIYMVENTSWQGYQFALNFDPQKLELQALTPHDWSTIGNWNTQMASQGTLVTSWIHLADPVGFGPDIPLATFRFRALETGLLKEFLSLSDLVIHPEGYHGWQGEKRDLQLTFVPQFKPGTGITLAGKTDPGSGLNKLGDFAPPTIECINGLNASLQPMGLLSIEASDLLFFAKDNATPTDQLRIGVRNAGAGVGFPVDALGDPIMSVSFSCDDLDSTRMVELWAMDASGNATYCTTSIVIQDNLGVCITYPIDLKICLTSICSGIPIENAVVTITGTSNFIPSFSIFGFPEPTGCMVDFPNFPITSTTILSVSKDSNPLNGMDEQDFLLLSRHIDGSQPFTEPWQWVAADANRDDVITLEDSLEFRNLMLGVYTELPNNSSWRFISEGYQFPAPNPLSQPLPDSVLIAQFLLNMDTSFVGIKIGDLDCSAIPDFTAPATGLRNQPAGKSTSVSGADLNGRNWNNKALHIGLPYPNPTSNAATLPIFLPNQENIHLEISDLAGKLLWVNDLRLNKGRHELEIPAAAMAQAGVYIWRIRAGEFMQAGKLLRF